MTYTLHLGDCLEYLRTLPAGSVDAVITDPVWPNAPAGMFPVDDPQALLHQALDGLDARRVVIIMRYDSDPRFLTAVPNRWPFFRIVCLPYIVPGYNGRKLGGYEYAYCFGEPVRSEPNRRVIPGMAPQVLKDPEPNPHPCPRHIRHMTYIVNWWSDPGETVLDPFAGSGTTGVACLQTGRNFIGCEINPGYFEIAKRRIEQAAAQPLLLEA